jgi:hypothetical protein
VPNTDDFIGLVIAAVAIADVASLLRTALAP